MIELIKKAMLTGLGVASLTKEKIEEIGRDFVEQGKLSQQEGEKLVEDLLAKAEESKQEIKKQIEERIEEILKKMNLVRMSDLDELKSQIKELQDSCSGDEKKR
jgi:polyhydroxyalkanoate synthesis regulator phasin